MVGGKPPLDEGNSHPTSTKVNTWEGIIGDLVPRLYSFDDYLDGLMHENFLEEYIPALIALFYNNVEPELHDNRILISERSYTNPLFQRFSKQVD